MRAMRYRSRLEGVSSDSGVLPLINVVFLLLMFFMVAGQISDHDDTLLLPESLSDSELAESTLRLEIRGQDELWLDGQRLQGSLEAALASRLSALSFPEATGKPETSVPILVVHVDRDLDVATLDPVLSAMRSLSLSRLQIATRALP